MGYQFIDHCRKRDPWHFSLLYGTISQISECLIQVTPIKKSDSLELEQIDSKTLI